MDTGSVIERAAALFSEGNNCAQSVAAACLEAGGLDAAQAISGLAPFGAGICYRQEICGAASGGLFALGVFTCSPEGNGPAYEAGKELIRRFETVCGALDCRTLLGQDITSPEGLAAARENGIFSIRCPHLVEKGAAVAAAVISEYRATSS